MSQTISRKNFTIFFIVYAIGSLVIYIGSLLFSLLAQLIALWILLPFYSICIFLRLLIPLIPLSNSYTVTVKYHKLLIIPILGFQFIKILSSPAICKGAHEQDEGCYSLIQVLLSKENLHKYSNVPIDWWLAGKIFPIALVFYLISIIIFLASIRMQKLTN